MSGLFDEKALEAARVERRRLCTEQGWPPGTRAILDAALAALDTDALVERAKREATGGALLDIEVEFYAKAVLAAIGLIPTEGEAG